MRVLQLRGSDRERSNQDALDRPNAGPIAVAAWAGIIGPVLFTAGFILQEALREGEYSRVAHTVSALETGPNGWIQQINFVVFGVLTLMFSVGLHAGIRRTRGGIAGPALLFVTGIGLLLAAVFPLRGDSAAVAYDPGGHVVGGVTFFAGSVLGLMVLSRRLSRDPRWRSVAGYTLVAGAIGFVGFVALGTLAIPDHAPLHPWAGLVQRVLLAVVLPCRIILSVRLRKAGMPN